MYIPIYLIYVPINGVALFFVHDFIADKRHYMHSIILFCPHISFDRSDVFAYTIRPSIYNAYTRPVVVVAATGVFRLRALMENFDVLPVRVRARICRVVNARRCFDCLSKLNANKCSTQQGRRRRACSVCRSFKAVSSETIFPTPFRTRPDDECIFFFRFSARNNFNTTRMHSNVYGLFRLTVLVFFFCFSIE